MMPGEGGPSPVTGPGAPNELQAPPRRPPWVLGAAYWIPATYAVVSVVWISFSDVLVSAVSATQEQQASWSIAKGIGFVAVTALLLHVGIRRALQAARDASRRIDESEARFRALADGAPVGIYEADAQARRRYFNREAERILGLSGSEAPDLAWTSRLHPDDRERVLAEWRRARDGGAAFACEYRVLRPDASTVLVRSQASPLHDDAGQIASYIGVLVDVTEQRALQSQLEITRRLSALGTLVAGIGHEVNNPLGAAIASDGFAAEEVGRLLEQVRRGEDVPRETLELALGRVAESLADAQDADQRVARVVRDLTSFGRSDAHRKRIRMVDVVDAAMRWLPTAVAGAATLQVEMGDVPDVVGSAGQLQQVIVNLVTNAAKSIPAGRRGLVTLRVAPGSSGTVRVEVVDDGVGIAPDVLDRVFDPFFTTRKVGDGMGLGLAISHAIVTAHSGTITASSEVGAGSTFRVELPAAPAET